MLEYITYNVVDIFLLCKEWVPGKFSIWRELYIYKLENALEGKEIFI